MVSLLAIITVLYIRPSGLISLLTGISYVLPGEFHGQRSLVGYSPWDRRDSDMTEQLTLSFLLFITFN